ncbi:Mitochondrial import inner membrane translocase subunit [Vigna angularis]|uniref:Mitochondrial import inner membrane translocase subunit n=1 Tax=Phaseolus angularis TaxID=3914 RepID=A0A8T0L074_PHAAN|nr:uncharacterized protein LOC108321222 isoform X5 [Vigna angularis]KAG2405587.1 Mitochondrial import inner membrane translocase subunit [Vigna angularis]
MVYPDSFGCVSIIHVIMEQIFGMAEKEMEYRVELFNKMTQTCFKKCVDERYKESELNMGENSCIDRCVSKYWQMCTIRTKRPPVSSRPVMKRTSVQDGERPAVHETNVRSNVPSGRSVHPCQAVQS